MTQNTTENIKETDLIRYFKSELEQHEVLRVEEWISVSEENRKIAEDIYRIVFGLDILNTIDTLSEKEALKNVNRKIWSQRMTKYAKSMQKIAALLFIPLFISVIYLLLKDINKEPEYITFKTNPGIIADFILPDGSKVWLNAHSELSYPSFFKGKKREVKLSGEAYFQVEQDMEQPFIVQLSDNVNIEVTGTEFNVDAYERSRTITAMLVSGGINMSYPSLTKTKEESTLKPGQKIFFEKKTRKVTTSYASPLVETGWKDGKIYLENTPLRHLLHTLRKRFDVDFILENKKIKDNYFTGTFGSQDLDLILKHLELSSGIRHKIKMPKGNDLDERIKIILY
ncbi:FecR domain-containing protein [Massilibacteroides sp.]|uniref:FecR family protein n=1 Tax=Massilibacteroides sp. TaxID=2034766 RepID=UPI002613736E|nr:FecR domain-containing protein [Massilibacteroides sp.]MDD4514340.1 FecR domain-containing protein [Massilibacteroides sp.]